MTANKVNIKTNGQVRQQFVCLVRLVICCLQENPAFDQRLAAIKIRKRIQKNLYDLVIQRNRDSQL